VRKETAVLIGLAQGGVIIPVMGIKGRLNCDVQFMFARRKALFGVSATLALSA